MGKWELGRWVWKFRWRRPWFEWETTLVEEFNIGLEGTNMRHHEEDMWVWLEDASSIFTVKCT